MYFLCIDHKGMKTDENKLLETVVIFRVEQKSYFIVKLCQRLG